MPYYRPRRPSNRELSGPDAHLNGKKITWEESAGYLNPDIPWTKEAGKIIRVQSQGSSAGKAFFINNIRNNTVYWIDPIWGPYRNIVVEGQEN